MNKFSIWLENLNVENPLYHGTAGKMFKNFDQNMVGKYDNGDLGVGVYLTPRLELAKDYAHQAEQRTGQPAIVLVVWHSFQNTADFDDQNVRLLLSNAGVDMNNFSATQRGQGLSGQMAQLITQIMTKNGYDSGKCGGEVVSYNQKLLKITKTYPLEDEFFSSQQQLNGPAPQPSLWQKLWKSQPLSNRQTTGP